MDMTRVCWIFKTATDTRGDEFMDRQQTNDDSQESDLTLSVIKREEEWGGGNRFDDYLKQCPPCLWVYIVTKEEIPDKKTFSVQRRSLYVMNIY